MNKKELTTAVSVILVIAVIVIVYLFVIKPKMSSVNGGTLPSLYVDTNPMKNAPDVNPVDKSNPFRSIKTNPFQ